MFSQRPDLFSYNRLETDTLSRSKVIYNDGIIYVCMYISPDYIYILEIAYLSIRDLTPGRV